MSFHVEIRRSFRHARAFNLGEEQLRQLLLAWVEGVEIELGDQRWDPQQSSITVLEGRHLESPELAFGQGWQNAAKSGEDVTDRVLNRIATAEAPAVAVLVASERPAPAFKALVEALGLRPVDWGSVRARLLASASLVGDSRPAAGIGAALIVLADDRALSPDRAFEVGLALGALGGRAIVVKLGDGPPPAELRDLGIIRIDGQPSLHALAERLRLAGCELSPAPGWDSPERFSGG